MPNPVEPEVLPPESPHQTVRERLSRGVFADDNLDLLTHLLDDWFRIPGTSIRFGLDGIVGLVPGLGDVLSGLASCIIVVAAWVRGVPYVTLMRMVVNLAVDVFIGAVPLLGDVFDIAWKANRRNFALMNRHLAAPRRHTWRDWLFLVLIFWGLGLVFITPLLVLAWLLGWVFHHAG